MWVTCYVDASFVRKTGGAWAVWLRCDEGRAVRRGACPPYVNDSTGAELAAIYAGVHLAVTSFRSRVDGVAVRSDCEGALRLADPAAPTSRKPALRALQEKLRAAVSAHRIALDLRWVRGHQPVGLTTAGYLNSRCDALARAARGALPPRAKAPRPR